METNKISFYPHWQPAIKQGKVTISIQQTVGDEIYKNDQVYNVAGTGLNLEASIAKIFPTENIEENNILPFVSFKNKSLPWEKLGFKLYSPWLGLLTFREDEIVEEFKNATYSAFKNNDRVSNLSDSGNYNNNDIDAEYFYIELDYELFNRIAPNPEDLKWLAHVREETPFMSQSEQYLQQLKDISNEEESPKYSFISGNRIPGPGINIVYLVSFENYSAKIETQGKIRLLVYKKWAFTYRKEKTIPENFKTYLEKLSENQKEKLVRLKFEGGDKNLEKALDEGFVPVRHKMRNGNETISFYRSPLIPFSSNDAKLNTTEIKGSDNAIRYNKELAMFDETYAAAFQLGRMMAMKNKDISKKLYYQSEKTVQSLLLMSHKEVLNKQEEAIPAKKWNRLEKLKDQISPSFEAENDENDEAIANWLGQLQILKGIPLNYLLPHPQILPKESISFFTVDRKWLLHLKEGALSIGGHTAIHKDLDKIINKKHLINSKNAAFNHIERNVLGHLSYHINGVLERNNISNDNKEEIPIISGLIIHSDFVTYWPGIHVEAKAKNENKEEECQILRSDVLAPKIRLYLFEGIPDTYTFYENKGSLAFGFEQVVDNKTTGQGEIGTLKKNLRKIDNSNIEEIEIENSFNADGKLDIQKLVNRFKQNNVDYTPAHFAYQMVQGAQNVEFKISRNGG